jgi:hypothetical protein
MNKIVGGAWAVPTEINGFDCTSEQMAGCNVGDTTDFVFWRSFDGRDIVFFSAVTAGGSWPQGATINTDITNPSNKTLIGPAAFSQNATVTVLMANAADNTIYATTATPAGDPIATVWPTATQVQPAQAAPLGLAACAFDDSTAFCFWPQSGTHVLACGKLVGGQWASVTVPNQTFVTEVPPAAAYFNGTLYLFWWDTDGTIKFATSPDGASWSSAQPVSTSDFQPVSGPTATTGTCNETLSVYWRTAAAADNIANSYRYPSSSAFAAPVGRNTGADPADLAPCAICGGGHIVLFWSHDVGGYGRMFFSTFTP